MPSDVLTIRRTRAGFRSRGRTQSGLADGGLHVPDALRARPGQRGQLGAALALHRRAQRVTARPVPLPGQHRRTGSEPQPVDGEQRAAGGRPEAGDTELTVGRITTANA